MSEHTPEDQGWHLREYGVFARKALCDSLHRGWGVIYVLTTLAPFLLAFIKEGDAQQAQHASYWNKVEGIYLNKFYLLAFIAVVLLHFPYACFKLYRNRKATFIDQNRKFVSHLSLIKSEHEEQTQNLTTSHETEIIRIGADHKEQMAAYQALLIEKESKIVELEDARTKEAIFDRRNKIKISRSNILDTLLFEGNDILKKCQQECLMKEGHIIFDDTPLNIEPIASEWNNKVVTYFRLALGEIFVTRYCRHIP
jgi:hypothetical protein